MDTLFFSMEKATPETVETERNSRPARKPVDLLFALPPAVWKSLKKLGNHLLEMTATDEEAKARQALVEQESLMKDHISMKNAARQIELQNRAKQEILSAAKNASAANRFIEDSKMKDEIELVGKRVILLGHSPRQEIANREDEFGTFIDIRNAYYEVCARGKIKSIRTRDGTLRLKLNDASGERRWLRSGDKIIFLDEEGWLWNCDWKLISDNKILETAISSA